CQVYTNSSPKKSFTCPDSTPRLPPKAGKALRKFSNPLDRIPVIGYNIDGVFSSSREEHHYKRKRR
ncbi:MAG: hypothetical protein IKU90_06335, partial [Clostridia bacterium]|nr:hypothetical protein [Clostridia bacterium]